VNAVNWNFFFIWWRFRRWFLSYILSWERDENWARVEMFFEQTIKVAWCNFDSSESRLEDEIDSRFKKTSIFFKVTLNTSMSLTWAAWSKLQALNSTMLSCIEDWLNWSAQETTEVLKKKEFQYLIFDKYSFWMTWRIQLEASCFRRETRLNEICFLWMNWVLIDFSWANERLYCFLWADEKLSCFFQANEKLDCFLWAIRELSYFLWVNWERDWREATLLTSSEKFSSCWLRS